MRVLQSLLIAAGEPAIGDGLEFEQPAYVTVQAEQTTEHDFTAP